MRKKWIKDLDVYEVIYPESIESTKILFDRFRQLGLLWISGYEYNYSDIVERKDEKLGYRPKEGTRADIGFYVAKGYTVYKMEDLRDFEEGFSLPKQWFIKGGKKLHDYLCETNQNRKITGYYTHIGYFINQEGEWAALSLNEDSGHPTHEEITLEEYIKSIESTQCNQEESIVFSPTNQKETIAMACKTWKNKLAKMFGYTLALGIEYSCPISEFENMLEASTSDQYRKFQKMFPLYFQPKIKKDTLVYVKWRNTIQWVMRYFSHYDNDGTIYCFKNQHRSDRASGVCLWDELSLTNPLENKKKCKQKLK